MVKKTETSPDPSWGYFDWLRVAEEGLRPLSKLMKPGKADLEACWNLGATVAATLMG